jgi:hypothetical protein
MGVRCLGSVKSVVWGFFSRNGSYIILCVSYCLSAMGRW